MDTIFARLTEALTRLQITTEPQASQLVEHARRVPPEHVQRYFLEHRLDEGQISLEGYGHGLRAERLSSLVAGPWGEGSLGSLVRRGLAGDPFGRANPLGDSRQDNEWIEYDVGPQGFGDEPALFFPPLDEQREFTSPQDTQALEERLNALLTPLPGVPEPDPLLSLSAFLDRGLSAGDASLRLYRIGLSEGRQPGWSRYIVSAANRQATAAMAAAVDPSYDAQRLDEICAALTELTGETELRFVLSVTVAGRHVCGVDVETPHFHRLRDPDERRAVAASFIQGLARRGWISSAQAEFLNTLRYGTLDLAEPDEEGPCATLMLDHFKFGLSGRSAGRLKSYLDLRPPADPN